LLTLLKVTAAILYIISWAVFQGCNQAVGHAVQLWRQVVRVSGIAAGKVPAHVAPDTLLLGAIGEMDTLLRELEEERERAREGGGSSTKEREVRRRIAAARKALGRAILCRRIVDGGADKGDGFVIPPQATGDEDVDSRVIQEARAAQARLVPLVSGSAQPAPVADEHLDREAATAAAAQSLTSLQLDSGADVALDQGSAYWSDSDRSDDGDSDSDPDSDDDHHAAPGHRGRGGGGGGGGGGGDGSRPSSRAPGESPGTARHTRRRPAFGSSVPVPADAALSPAAEEALRRRAARVRRDGARMPLGFFRDSYDWLRSIVREWCSDLVRSFGVEHTHLYSIPSAEEKFHILEVVMLSSRVRAAMASRASSAKEALPRVQAAAFKTLKGMAADINIVVVRLLTWAFSKVLRLFYPFGVQVDTEQVERVRRVARRRPLLYLPTHKSHLDYLLVGHMCLSQNLPMPHVVAGENLNIPVVGAFLRYGGAFFIRRSFGGGDPVYPALFNEYCVQLLKHGYSIECFIEGGRARSGKLLQPKTGFLRTIVEAIASNALEDAYVVPVSIVYDRIVEHESHITELSGAEKEPEKLGSFIRTVTTLIWEAMHQRLCFGRIDMDIAEPFSLRQFLQDRSRLRYDFPFDREHAVPLPLRADFAKRAALNVGFRVLWDANVVSKVLPTALVGTILLTQHDRGILYDELVSLVEWLHSEIVWRGGEVVEQEGLTRADSIAMVVRRVLSQSGGEELIKKHKSFLLLKLYSPAEKMELSMLRNQLIHHFVSECLFCASMYALEKGTSRGNMDPRGFSRAELFARFRWLGFLLAREFIYRPVPGSTSGERRFQVAVRRLTERGVVLRSIANKLTRSPGRVFSTSVPRAASEAEAAALAPTEAERAAGMSTPTTAPHTTFDDANDEDVFFACNDGSTGHVSHGIPLDADTGASSLLVPPTGDAGPSDALTTLATHVRRDSTDRPRTPATIARRAPVVTFYFLCSLIWPFIDAYWIASLSLLRLLPARAATEKSLVAFSQKLGEVLFFEGQLDLYEAISKETITNAMTLFARWSVVESVTIEGTAVRGLRLTPSFSSRPSLDRLIYRIGSYKKRSRSYASRRYKAARGVAPGETPSDVQDAIERVLLMIEEEGVE
jgi:1-acyl-sn-glycerol-3-phosphate acyltransferase